MPFVFTAKEGTSGDSNRVLVRCCVNQGRNPPCRKCPQCQAYNIRTRRRCRNRTCKDFRYCHTHLKRPFLEKQGNQFIQRHIGVSISPSRIPGGGMGLFATKRFERDQKIVEYGGIARNMATLDDAYDYIGTNGVLVEPTAPYAIDIGTTILDAACLRGAGAFANDPQGTQHRANARIVPGSTYLTATTTIRPGDEIYVSYGDIYWQWVGPAFIQFSTKYIRPGKR